MIRFQGLHPPTTAPTTVTGGTITTAGAIGIPGKVP
jgi:hypothetical protein